MSKVHGRSKSVLQLDKKTGVVLGVWSSEIEAAADLDINQSNISKAARGDRMSAGGFKWTFNVGTPES